MSGDKVSKIQNQFANSNRNTGGGSGGASFSSGFGDPPSNSKSNIKRPNQFSNGFQSSTTSEQQMRNNTSTTFQGFGQKPDIIGLKVAKASKKMNKIPLTRPALEIYRPPVLRRDFSATKSSEDLSTKPITAAGSKQLHLNKQDFKRGSTEHLRHYGLPYNSSNTHSHQPQQHYTGNAFQQGKMHYKSRTFSHNKSAENLRSQHHYQQHQFQNTNVQNGKIGANRYSNNRRSVTPPPQSIRDSSHHQQQKTIMHQPANVAMKRSSSFVKDIPKKKTFGPREAQEAKLLLENLGVAQDDTISQWVSSNFESSESATPVGQLLVQMCIEQSKAPKIVGKLCALLIDCPTGEQFHKGLVTSSLQYFDCRVKLKIDHFRFWLSFINSLSELYANLGFTYEGELVQILLQVYEYLLRPDVLEDIKIEELESLISSLLMVGYNLERQCPDKLTDFLAQLRDAFIQAHEPWVRKMLLLMIELSASDWKLPPEANDYYFQTHYSSSSASG